MESLVLFVCAGTAESYLLSQNTFEVKHVSSVRRFKKALRDAKPALVLLGLKEEADELLANDAAQYIRSGLSNTDTRMAILRASEHQVDESIWMEGYQVNSCLVDSEACFSYNRNVLLRELETFRQLQNTRKQHDIETEMLMSISQFSREDGKLSKLLKQFSESLSALCHASHCFHIHVKKNGIWRLEHTNCENAQALDALNTALKSDDQKSCLAEALREQHPQINLLQHATDLDAVVTCLDEKIGSYLTFPVVVYGRTVCLLLYLIPEAEIAHVSMKQINIVNKASEQLTTLLERKQAETSLKKQYARLKNTLLELKTAKEELAHKDKMLGVGRVAAGIAHEINNPLAYVISNVSSMDKYLDSILQKRCSRN
jgi:hypothetical protein